MTFDQQALVRAILRSPRIRRKLVVLCEGDPLALEAEKSAPSPQMYGRLERTPDSAFYAACIPRDWHGIGLPRFYNCGGRSQVINTFFSLLEAHHAKPEDSYLSPEKLYALVDLDLGPERMPDGYVCATTEDVHAALYSNGLLNASLDSRHRIWTTAVVHKEAFFVLPGIDRAWRTDSVPFLNGGPLVLRDVHLEAARRLETDPDLAGNFATLVARLKRFSVEGLDCSSPSGLGDSWLAVALRASADGYDLIVRALLAVAKIKPIWGQVEPDPRLKSSLSPEVYREQLVLKIGQEIARLDPARHSLTGFFSWLKQHR